MSVQGNDEIAFVADDAWTAEALLNLLKNCSEHIPQNSQIQVSYSQNPLYTEFVD